MPGMNTELREATSCHGRDVLRSCMTPGKPPQLTVCQILAQSEQSEVVLLFAESLCF